MAVHKFVVGQTLQFSAGRMGLQTASRKCKVLRLLPMEDGQPLYRIKCDAEMVERMAKESQLSRVS